MKTSYAWLAPLALVLGLAGCAGSSGPQSSETAGGAAGASASPSWGQAPGGECNADNLQGSLGQPLSDSLAAQLLQQSGSATARTLRPGQVVTMEYNPQRLNVLVDDNNVITAIRCG
ncbi:I78 family peptidase inhibitor [Orrella sp. JC864]|uniref:I78 family peptidase inhibitor n=1 Tax=Orrella sp. JC864 TaxID=3120298 RepID=UPI0012BBC820